MTTSPSPATAERRRALLALLEGWFGYDPSALAPLSPEDRRWTRVSSALGLLPLALSGLGYGYACHLLLASPVLGILTGILAILFIWNLQRLAVAGTGIAPHITPEDASRWRSNVVPVLVLAYIGFLASQPLILWVDSGRLDAAVEGYRMANVAGYREALNQTVLEPGMVARYQASRRILDRRTRLARLEAQIRAAGTDLQKAREAADGAPLGILEQALAGLDQDRSVLEGEINQAQGVIQAADAEAARVEATSVKGFRDRQESSQFMVYRIRREWERPLLPSILSILGVLAMVAPLLVRHRTALKYELLRHGPTRDRVFAGGTAVQARVVELLSAYPTYRSDRGEHYLDPPFNSRRAVPAPIPATPYTGKELLAVLPDA